MTFTRFVEIGRVAYCVYGPDAGKLVVIVDVIDQNRALVDGPKTGVTRKSMNFKHMHLTKFVMPVPRSARTGIVTKIWEKEEISKKWEESAWAKKIANKEKRTQMSDFDRFKLMKAQQARNRLINIQFGKLKKGLKANPPQVKKRINKKPSNK